MRVDVRGTRLWFDVDGPALVPDGPAMRERTTVVLLHGGPGFFGHSLGGCVAMLLVLQSTFGRFDLGRIVEELRRAGGDEAAATAERVYGGDRSSVSRRSGSVAGHCSACG